MPGLPSFMRKDRPAARLVTLAALSRRGAWETTLAHDRDDHLLIWITKGQGLALLDGKRRGVGIHNAVFVPARHLFSIDLGRQGFAQALVMPRGLRFNLPSVPLHLRIREVGPQAELVALLDAVSREQGAGRLMSVEALTAYCELICIWLHRQTAELPKPVRRSAGHRLISAYADRIVAQYRTGAVMADYAEALDVTPTHLTRVCRAETGRTAAALLTERILHATRGTLLDSDAPVQAIAGQLGFRSAAYFTRFVQHHTGLPPTKLRQQTPEATLVRTAS